MTSRTRAPGSFGPVLDRTSDPVCPAWARRTVNPPTTRGCPVEFAVAEYVDRTFGEMCAQLRTQPVAALRAAASPRTAQLRAEAGSLVVVGPETAVRRVAWRDAAGHVQVEAEVRVLGVNRGAEPVTELMLIGHDTAGGHDRSAVVAWARGLLTGLADYPRARGRAVGSRPSGAGRSWARPASSTGMKITPSPRDHEE